MPSSPEAFREFAQECLRWAGETKSERHRQALLEMSRTWIQAALEVERGSVHRRPQTSSFASQASASHFCFEKEKASDPTAIITKPINAIT